MSTKLYVGNLSFQTSEDEVRDIFSEFGNVTEATLIIDKLTGRSRGFAFVSFDTSEAADAAVSKLDGQEVGGRRLTVNIARPKEDRPSFGGGGGGPRHGGGGYGGGGGGGRDRDRGPRRDFGGGRDRDRR